MKLREAIEAFRGLDQIESTQQAHTKLRAQGFSYKQGHTNSPAQAVTPFTHPDGRVVHVHKRSGKVSQPKTEAVATITEAKVGDYVTTTDGRGGYVQSSKGGKLVVMLTNQPSNPKGSIFYVDAGNVKVNPGGPPV